MHGYNEPPIENYICRVQWSRDRWRHMTPKGQTRDTKIFETCIFVFVQDKHIIVIDQQYESAHAESDGYATDNVTWPQKVKHVTPKSFLPRRIFLRLSSSQQQVSLTACVYSRCGAGAGAATALSIHPDTSPVLRPTSYTSRRRTDCLLFTAMAAVPLYRFNTVHSIQRSNISIAAFVCLYKCVTCCCVGCVLIVSVSFPMNLTKLKVAIIWLREILQVLFQRLNTRYFRLFVFGLSIKALAT